MLSQKYDSANGAVLAERGDLHEKESPSQDFTHVFAKIANDLAQDAFNCSVLCNCESSGQTSQDDKILECSSCGFGICHTCTSLHQIEGHQLKEIITDGKKQRPNPHEFEMKLRCLAPSVLSLGKSWEDTIPDCKGLESYSFQLQRVDRMRRHWLLTYGAWEDHGSGRQVAEIRVQLGQIEALGKDVGLAAYIKCFSPAIRLQNPKRGVLGDTARLILKVKDSKVDKDSSKWEISAKASTTSLEIVGSDPCDSLRVMAGLNDTAPKALKNHKPMKKFTKNFPTSRNNLLHYHSKWKTWPGTIEISGDDNDLVNGTYKKQSCQHTVVLSALWRRDATDELPAMYLYIRPDVMRTGLDVAVISKTPSYHDKMAVVCELKDWVPENTLVEKTHTTDAKFLNWEAKPELALKVPEPAMITERSSAPFHDQIVSGQSEPPVLCEMSGLSDKVMSSLLQHSTDSDDNTVIPIDLVGKMGSRNAKRVSILAAPALLKYAAEGKLPLDLLNWYKLTHPKECSFGLSEETFPSRPEEKWKAVEKTLRGKAVTKYEREFDAEESNAFYHVSLNLRSIAFSFICHNLISQLFPTNY